MTQQIESQPSRPTGLRAIVLVLAVIVVVVGVVSIVILQTEPSEDVSDPVTLGFLAALIKTGGYVCPQPTSASKVGKQAGESVYVVNCTNGRFRVTIADGKETVVEALR
jgi:hypothetical protein